MRVDLEPDAAEAESRDANEEEDTKPAVILTLRSLYTKFEAWDEYRADMDEARKDFAKAEVLLDREIEKKRRRTTSSVDAVSAESKMSDDEAKEKKEEEEEVKLSDEVIFYKYAEHLVRAGIGGKGRAHRFSVAQRDEKGQIILNQFPNLKGQPFPEGDWVCPNCGVHVHGKRDYCFACDHIKGNRKGGPWEFKGGKGGKNMRDEGRQQESRKV